MKLILLGYMASGKSFIGEALANILNFEFVDLDAYIALKEDQSIRTLFDTKGEIYFRKKEHEYLKEIIHNNNSDMVLALGGGTPCYSDNITILNASNSCKTIYLNVSIPVLVDRLLNDSQNRPLVTHITNKDEMIEFVGKHLFERSHYYNQSDLIIDGNQQKEKIIEAIIARLF